MRAITLLSQREHSRAELKQKLLRIQRRDMAASLDGDTSLAEARSAQEDADAPTPCDPTEEVEALLNCLQQQGYLSDERFVDSRIHARAGRYGDRRIKQELAQHGLSLSPESSAALKASEFERAKTVWHRKFGGQPAQDAATKAKQIRFMMARGFGSDTVRKLLKAEDE